MKPYSIFSIIAAFALLTFVASSRAQQLPGSDVPRTISYQGLLTSSGGTALPDGNYDITVTLYSDPGGVHPIWTHTYNTPTHNGIFNLYLGSETAPLPDPQKMNTALWVGTSVNGTQEMLPLTPLTASPYALNLPDNAVTTGKLADGAVTAEKVDMDYVAAITVNGERISGKGRVLDIRGGEGITLDYDETSNVLNLSKQNRTGTTDREKGGSQTLDNTDGSENWMGRTNAASALTFVAPVGAYNTLAGGESNSIGSGTDISTITGGQNNAIDNDVWGTFIGGGESNYIDNVTNDAAWSVIAGGHLNYISDWHAFIGGGHINIVTGGYGVVGGGESNTVGTDHSFIGGGELNTILQSEGGVISGGNQNTLTSTTPGGANYSIIAGGQNNSIDGQYGLIGGGSGNSITAYNGTIGGGRSNTVSGSTGTIAGGFTNTVAALEGFIGSGSNNLIDENANHSVLAGGEGNVIQPIATHGTIGGGSGNVIVPAPTSWSGVHSLATIPGGDNLIAQSWAQTVIGGWNIAKGAMPFRYQATPIPLSLLDGPIFIIGNGNSNENRSNAFEVSYNGHSIVYDENGTGGYAAPPGRGVVEGGTYTDNTIYGWANVNANGQLIGGCADLGIKKIEHSGPGVYRITLNIVKSDGITPATISCGAVVATLGSGTNPPVPPAPPSSVPPNLQSCAQIYTTNILNNVFEVYITSVGSDCHTGTDRPFKFHVTGRVNE